MDDENAVVILLTNQVQEHLETLAVKVYELIEARFFGGGFHEAVQIDGLKLPLHVVFGLEAD